MSTIGFGARRITKSTDYDAAQALLDLQSNNTPEGNSDPCGWRELDGKDDLEMAAKLILSCFISTDIANKSDINGSVNRNNSHLPLKPSNIVKKNIEPLKTSRKVDKSMTAKHDSHYKSNNRPETKSNTSDAQTQTEEKYLNPNIQLMETTIKNLCNRIKSLEAQIKTSIDQSMDESSFETGAGKQDMDSTYEDDDDKDPDIQMAVNETNTVHEFKYSQVTVFESSSLNDSRSHQINKNVQYNGVLSNHNTHLYDLVPIGYGNATVPSRLLKHINWNSYSSATRKLLTAVFSRRILATHSLTGKPSPAFPNKPAKKKLNPMLVNDIVQTVVERCRVPENVVRTSITTKCADESKMLRTREKNKKKRSTKKNRENVLPASDSDSENYC